MSIEVGQLYRITTGYDDYACHAGWGGAGELPGAIVRIIDKGVLGVYEDGYPPTHWGLVEKAGEPVQYHANILFPEGSELVLHQSHLALATADDLIAADLMAQCPRCEQLREKASFSDYLCHECRWGQNG